MSTTFTSITPNAKFGQSTLQLVQQILNTQANAAHLLAIAQGMVDFGANPLTYTAIETNFGLASGQGSQFYAWLFALANPAAGQSQGVLFGQGVTNFTNNIG